MKLNASELLNLINIVGQVSVPVASKEAETLKGLINKMSKMMDEFKKHGKKDKKTKT